jgi:hypothetical protein
MNPNIIDIPAKASKRWNTSGIKSIARLQFDFLQISPSYELANQVLNERISDPAALIQKVNDLYQPKNGLDLTQEESLEVFADFMEVIKLRTMFGDLNVITFDAWWRQIGGWYYGSEHEPPKVKLITTLGNDANQLEEAQLLSKCQELLNSYRKKEKTSKALLVSIPLGVPKNKLLKQLNALIDAHKVPIEPLTPDKHPFELQRFRIDALTKALFVLKAWACLEESVPLWLFGVITNVSPKNSKNLTINSQPTKLNIVERNTLAVLMHRSFSQAQYIAENAAHGHFPSREKCRLPIFNQVKVNARLIKINELNSLN